MATEGGKTRVAIVGATGYTGAELVRILSDHPHVELTVLTSRSHAGKKFTDIYPAMAGIIDLACETYSADAICERADVVFTALPHRLPMALIPDMIAAGKKVIDLSADFRFDDPQVYEAAYQPHSAPELLSRAVYGLSEIYRESLAGAQLVGNPGCYPTSVLLPLIPVLKAGLIDEKQIIADSKSGVSGAGREPTLTNLYCSVAESFKAYKIAAHRHQPEIERILSREKGRPVRLTFTPHLVPMSRGMLTTLYLTPLEGVTPEQIEAVLKSAYATAPFVRLLPYGKSPDTLHVRGTNFCDIGCKIDPHTNVLILLAAIDNLVKGAAGQAVQNMNIMLGLDERAGLSHTPYAL